MKNVGLDSNFLHVGQKVNRRCGFVSFTENVKKNIKRMNVWRISASAHFIEQIMKLTQFPKSKFRIHDNIIRQRIRFITVGQHLLIHPFDQLILLYSKKRMQYRIKAMTKRPKVERLRLYKPFHNFLRHTRLTTRTYQYIKRSRRNRIPFFRHFIN
ncbi:hypothetical protein HanPI659440_Chr09g0333041 [Helianthus annuus]|nr:hypothetical protein HanPI659440_Chr09g0333041 [Helianthus annuus]